MFDNRGQGNFGMESRGSNTKGDKENIQNEGSTIPKNPKTPSNRSTLWTWNGLCTICAMWTNGISWLGNSVSLQL